MVDDGVPSRAAAPGVGSASPTSASPSARSSGGQGDPSQHMPAAAGGRAARLKRSGLGEATARERSAAGGSAAAASKATQGAAGSKATQGKVASHAAQPGAVPVGPKIEALHYISDAGGNRRGRGGQRFFGSLRNRIVVPVALAAVALIVLGAVQTGDSLSEARAAERARVLARLSSAAAVLIHHVEMEYTETNALRQRGGEAGAQLLTAAQARTDAARLRFEEAARVARTAGSNVDHAVTSALESLVLLPAVRNLAPGSADGSVEVIDVYNQISEHLIAVADSAPARITDPGLAAVARSVALVAGLEHLAAEQLDLLRRAFTRQRLAPGELVRLANLAGSERLLRDELWRLTGPAKEQFTSVVKGPDVERAAAFRDTVLATDGGIAALRVDPDVWYAAQSGLLRRMRVLEIELTAILEHDARDIQLAARTRSLATGGLTLLVVVGTLTGAITLAVRASRRMRRVRDSALGLASSELPAAVSQVGAARDSAAIDAVVTDSTARIDAMMAAGSDEIGELGMAFGAVHRQALRLAADQSRLRMEMVAIFVALSRRGQTLAQRQLRLIDEIGKKETDPHRLKHLYSIDHLAARMRRNEENLLVLAGGEPGRRFFTPVAVRDAIAAAVEEVEDHQRIEITGAPAVAIVAHAIGDVIHLLAELLENATTFSPPTKKVRVAARQTVESVYVTVFDEGIGMTPDKVAEANQRLRRPAVLTSTLVGTMGLLVVAQLAARHGIGVQLSSTPRGGTAATVTLPAALLAPEAPTDHLRRNRWRGTEVGWPDLGAAEPMRPSFVESYPTQAAGPAPAGSRPAVTPRSVPGAVPARDGMPQPVVSAPAVGSVPVRPAAGSVLASGAAPAGFVESTAASTPAAAPATPTRDHASLPRRQPAQQQSFPGHQPGPGEVGHGHGRPAGPAEPVPDPGTASGYTAAGLPRRVAGAGRPPEAPDRVTVAGAPPAAGPPDPDSARARLSSLASGIAAAQRRNPNLPPNQPS